MHVAVCVLLAVATLATALPAFMRGRPVNGMMNGPVIKHYEDALKRTGVQTPPDLWYVS